MYLFNKNVKIYKISLYSEPITVSNHFYVSKLSIDFMKVTFSRMDTFFVPYFLPTRYLKCVVSPDNDLKLTIKVCKN